jgi:hypothetical protein
MLMNNPLETLRFYLISSEPRAYLVGRSDESHSFTVELSQSHPGFWFAEVPLPAGTYRTRFYCGDERQMTYFGPASCDGSWQEGLDAVVVVHESERMKAASAAARDAACKADFMQFGPGLLEKAGDLRWIPAPPRSGRLRA